MDLSEFYFRYPKTFVVPVEHLSPAGMSAWFAEEVRRERGVSAEWVEFFNAAFAAYGERVTGLASVAPKHWRAPRLANVCIVQDADSTRPYYQPFAKSSWLLYESDFDPRYSNLEYAVYQLVHAERLGVTGDPAMTWIHNLSYFIARSNEERSAFAAACKSSRRPDADAFSALGELMGIVRAFYHDDLRPAAASANEATARISAAGLEVPETHRAAIQALPKTCLAATRKVVQRYYSRQQISPQGEQAARTLVEWLVETKPAVLLTDHQGGTIWDPEQPDATDALEAVLDGIACPAAESLKQDWALIDRHTRAFLDALVDPDALAPPGDSLDQEDGIYIHASRKIVAYSFAQPGLRTLAEEAPPYHRLLVGARTVHEWGHLAVDAGMVAVPEEFEETHTEARRELIDRFNDLVSRSPAEHRATAEREVELLAKEGYRLGEMPLQRVDDYLANVLARHFLSVGEMESYIRANVRSLIDEPEIGPYLRLARHAYEYQYLLLSQIEDPFHYFVSSTWFAEQYFETGIIDESQTRELFAAVSRLFGCYRIDHTRIRL